MRKPKTKDRTEWWVKQQVKQILKDTGWTFWMPSADVFGRGGVSDFLAIKRPGLFMAIETKYDDVPTPLQLKFLTDVYEAGHFAFLVDETNIDELHNFLMCGNRIVNVNLMKWQNQEAELAEKLDS